MNDSWHIPRASLAPTSHTSQDNIYVNSNASTISIQSNETPASRNSQQSLIREDIFKVKAVQNCTQLENDRALFGANAMKKQLKRASHSSQGSNDSRTSTQSANSGSLLLTAANLEKLAEVHRQKRRTKSNLNANLLLASQGDILISIESNLPSLKTKEMDTVSIASSTHFTIVNGEGGCARKPTGGLCSHGKQVTVVIVSMSILFLIIILSMVYALELRARDMRRS